MDSWGSHRWDQGVVLRGRVVGAGLGPEALEGTRSLHRRSQTMPGEGSCRVTVLSAQRGPSPLLPPPPPPGRQRPHIAS